MLTACWVASQRILCIDRHLKHLKDNTLAYQYFHIEQLVYLDQGITAQAVHFLFEVKGPPRARNHPFV